MSEFGKGYAYCLGLFAAHADRAWRDKEVYEGIKSGLGPEMWFYCASDHLFELVIPDFLPQEQQDLARNLKELSIRWRMTYGEQIRATWEDVQWAIQTAKDLLRGLDEHLGIESEKGDWE